MNQLSDCLRLLADDNRLRILHLLEHEPLTVAELQDILQLSQSSVSSHLGKLKRAGFLYDVAEGSAHRYRLREDIGEPARACWLAVRQLSGSNPAIADDRRRLAELRSATRASWVERVAGHLHREYAPGRTWEALGHAFLAALDLGDCLDVGAGDGAMMELLLGSCRSLTCVDPAAAMVAAGKRRIAEGKLQGAEFIQASAEDMQLAPQRFDSVLFLQSLQYIADPQAALARALELLRPKGRLICLTLSSHDYPEAERYGHRHPGFQRQQLLDWVQGRGQARCLTLAPEAKPPRFTPLLLTVTC